MSVRKTIEPVIPAFLTFGPLFMVLFGESGHTSAVIGALALGLGLILVFAKLNNQEKQIADLRAQIESKGLTK